MNEMSLQQVIEYWTYLQDQAELKKKEYFGMGVISTARRDEVRAELEMCAWIVKSFSENFENPITSAHDILHGLSAKQTAGFMDYLDAKIIEFKVALEASRRHRQEALTRVPDEEYDKAKSIYLEGEVLIERQIMAWEHAHKGLVSILQEI